MPGITDAKNHPRHNYFRHRDHSYRLKLALPVNTNLTFNLTQWSRTPCCPAVLISAIKQTLAAPFGIRRFQCESRISRARRCIIALQITESNVINSANCNSVTVTGAFHHHSFNSLQRRCIYSGGLTCRMWIRVPKWSSRVSGVLRPSLPKWQPAERNHAINTCMEALHDA